MEDHLKSFSQTSLLGQRATYVYEYFLRSLHLPGDIAECGVFTGETSKELIKYLEQNAIDKIVHMFDSFQGFPDVITSEERDLSTAKELVEGYFFSTSETVIQNLGVLRQYKLHQGMFADTFAEFAKPLCFIHADADLYQSTVEIIGLADRCLVPGGWIVFDDYHNPLFPGVDLAIERYLDPGRYRIIASPESIQCYAVRQR